MEFLHKFQSGVGRWSIMGKILSTQFENDTLHGYTRIVTIKVLLRVGKLSSFIYMHSTIYICPVFSQVFTVSKCSRSYQLLCFYILYISSNVDDHSITRANLNKSGWLVTNTTAASKYIPTSASIEIPPFQTTLYKIFKNCFL